MSCDFKSVFSESFRNEKIHLCLVSVDSRRYIVAGCYSGSLKDTNLAVAGVGSHEDYPGEIAIFYLKRYRSELMRGAPVFKSRKFKDETLGRVLTA
jgi:hypothetical protein